MTYITNLRRTIARLSLAALLAGTLAACQLSSPTAPTPAGAGPVSAAATSAPAAPTSVPPAPTASASATRAPTITPEQAIKAALLAQYPGAAMRLRCAEGDFAVAAVAPLGGQHGFDAFLHQQNGAWAILTNGVGVSRDSLLALGFPETFCGMPPADNPVPAATPDPLAPLIGPEWTPLTTGDLDRNGREDVIAFKAAPLIPVEPTPGSQPKDVFVAFRELAVVERAADGAPVVRLLINTSAVLADNQVIAQIPAADHPTSGVLAELRYLERSFELRLIDDTGATGRPFVRVRHHEDTGAYAAEPIGAQPALTIGAISISPSEPAPSGPDSGPSGRLVQAGAIVTLSVPVQGARQVRFFADALGQSGNGIGSSTDPKADRAEFTWTVPAGAGQLVLYAQAHNGVGDMVTSAQVPLVVKAPVSSEYDLPEALLRAYYDAINAKDYARAYGYWENPPNPTLEEFTQGYSNTASVAVLLGQPVLQGAAGSQYARIPTVLAATTNSGGLEMFSGCYVARETTPGADTSSQAGKWLLHSATIGLAPPNVPAKQLLAQGCQL